MRLYENVSRGLSRFMQTKQTVQKTVKKKVFLNSNLQFVRHLLMLQWFPLLNKYCIKTILITTLTIQRVQRKVQNP